MTKSKIDLALIISVFNEEACILEMINSWFNTMNQLQISFKLIILNDGSTDQTTKALNAFSGNTSIEVIHKKNSGHGPPPVLLEYKKATDIAIWVLKYDNHNEMKAIPFPPL